MRTSIRDDMKEERRLFILRRALWYGQVYARDLVEAFSITRQAAYKSLRDAWEHWTWTDDKGYTHKMLSIGRSMVSLAAGVKEGGRYPPEAGAYEMLKLIGSGAEFRQTGLRPREVDVVFPWNRLRFVGKSVMSVILEAVIDRSGCGLMKRRIIEVEYVGLKAGDIYRKRRLVPAAVNLDGGQPRLYAHDIDQDGYPLKVYVLTRMRNARILNDPLPKSLTVQELEDPLVSYRIMFDPRLTDDQRDAMARELGVDNDGVVRVPLSQAHSFRRFYTNDVPPEGRAQEIIWPPVIYAERMND
ncbi:hypothetical protein [Pelomicrobium methylotrophicum]|uniref:WYL domain-containing protein n=1 Tax=Pelomicrobium methylotrophicum TaxID=2602750 RepID=A0A5C7EDY6_9PROT|nr:hypothetical protein [Pelomicrobium methylotrophicum]TXF10357.1 hypothetical protein FR698_15655 [Pelomicrobium methylotrophicum]